jgi:DNA-binding NarL/FixJ family response regulator
MKVILVGPVDARRRLAARAREAALEIVGEFDGLAAARKSGLACDAFLVPPDPDVRDGALEEALTAREVDVLEHLAQGMSNKVIAGRLGISDQTVKFHVASIAAKLGARNRTDAVRRAVRRGLIVL